MARVIDTHGHYMPLKLMDAFRTTRLAKSTSFLWDDPAYSDLSHHITVMDKVGVDAEVLVPSALLLESFGAAGISSEEGMRTVNDAYAAAEKAHPGRFIGTIAIDPFAGTTTLREIERGVTKLGLKAISMMTSYDGLYSDTEQFWPIYKLAQELDILVMLHPVAVTPYWKEMQRAEATVLRAEVSMLVDNTIAVGRMVRYGVYDKFPEVNFLYCQLGGMIPFIYGRFDCFQSILMSHAWEDVKHEAILNPPKTLREYKGRIMGDCHSMDHTAIELAAENLGVDCMVFGGDYPISPWHGSMKMCFDEIHAARLSTKDKEKILGGNAARLLKLDK